MAIPIWTLTGYLGSGKTTTLNCLLESPMFADKKLALVINEFGQMGIDGALVRSGDYPKYEINKGSIFCICTKTDFINALTEISGSGIEAVLVEATGIAETRDIQGFIEEPYLAGEFEIAANICVVDAMNFTKVAPFLKPVTGQLMWADMVVINKTDLITESELARLEDILAGYNPDAPMVRSEFGRFDVSELAKAKHIVRGGDMAEEPPPDLVAVTIKNDGTADRDKFMGVLEKYAENILRLKGNIDFADGGGYVEVVCGELLEGPREPNLRGGSVFTVIAWKLGKETLKVEFEGIFTSR